MVGLPGFRTLSAINDPIAYYVRLLPGSDVHRTEHAVAQALKPFPGRQGADDRRVQPVARRASSTRSSICSTRCWP